MRIFLFIIAVTVDVGSISRLFMSPKVRRNLYFAKERRSFRTARVKFGRGAQWRAQPLIPDSFPCRTNGADGERGQELPSHPGMSE